MKRSIVALLPLALVAACHSDEPKQSYITATEYTCGPYVVHHSPGADTAHFVGQHSTATLTKNAAGNFVSHGQKGPVITFDGNKINRQWRGDYACSVTGGEHGTLQSGFNAHANYVPRD